MDFLTFLKFDHLDSLLKTRGLLTCLTIPHDVCTVSGRRRVFCQSAMIRIKKEARIIIQVCLHKICLPWQLTLHGLSFQVLQEKRSIIYASAPGTNSARVSLIRRSVQNFARVCCLYTNTDTISIKESHYESFLCQRVDAYANTGTNSVRVSLIRTSVQGLARVYAYARTSINSCRSVLRLRQHGHKLRQGLPDPHECAGLCQHAVHPGLAAGGAVLLTDFPSEGDNGGALVGAGP